MVDVCSDCNVPDRDYDLDDPDLFTCSDCVCFSCEFRYCCEGQCVGNEE